MYSRGALARLGLARVRRHTVFLVPVFAANSSEALTRRAMKLI